MVTRLQRSLLAITRQLGFRAAMFSLIGVGAALIARRVDRYLPQELPFTIGADAVESILGVLASSMLAVTIFSLSTMVSALSAATNSVSPRARRLLQQDRTSLNALSTFMGAFLFSLVGLIALNTGYYGERGRLVLLVATIGMVVVVVVTLLQWIDRVSSLGGVIETTARVEATARKALEDRACRPALGGRGVADDAPLPAGRPVFADRIGYLQHVDMRALQSAARDCGATVRLLRLPGSYLTPETPVAWIAPGSDDGLAAEVRSALTVDDTRSFDQDPRFGLLVMSEIASHALSPAVNDPGTAIDVVGRMLRLLLAVRDIEPNAPEFDAVDVPLLDPRDLVEDAFGAIARDGAGQTAVMQRLQKALLSLAENADDATADAAADLSAHALELADGRLPSRRDLDAVARLAGGFDRLRRRPSARAVEPSRAPGSRF